MAGTKDFAFLHGGGQGGWIWDETLAALKTQAGASASAIAFDLPGCGAKRGIDTSRLSVRDVAAAFEEDLASSGLRDIVLVGHSNAGTIMPLVAAARPDLIGRLVYVSCVAPPPGVSVYAMRRGSHAPEQNALGDYLRAMFCNDMSEAYANAFMAKLGKDNWPTAQALEETDWSYDHLAGKPATYVICLQDKALIPSQQEESAERLQVQRRVLIDAGHQVMNTRPHTLAEILLSEAAL